MIASLNRLSVPVLAAGLFLSGYATLFGEYEQLRIIIVILMVIGSGMGFLMLGAHGMHPRLYRILLAGAALIALTAVSLCLGAPEGVIDYKSLFQTLTQLVLVCGWIVYCSYMEWDQEWLWKILAVAGLACGIANLVIWFQSGFQIPFAGFATAKNSLATAAMTMGFVALGTLHVSRSAVAELLGWALLGSSVLVLIASGGRSALIVLASSAFAYWAWPLLIGTRKRQLMTLTVVFGISFMIPLTYLNLDKWAVFRTMDRYSKNYFGLSVYTGRESLWPSVMDGIEERPYYGHGSKANMRFTRHMRGGQTQEHSAHNLYLATLYQVGIVGLFGVALLISAVWWSYFDVGFLWLTRVAGAFFLGILLRENFEVSLTQNNLQMGVGEWAIIACGICPWFDDLVREQAEEDGDGSEDNLYATLHEEQVGEAV